MIKTPYNIEQEICQLYPTTRTAILEDKYGLSRATIRNILIRNGVKLKPKHVGNKYDFNINFFNSIDTESKAYILGLLYADGCHYKPTRQISIELNTGDIDILQKIRTAMDSNHPLTECFKITKIGRKRNSYTTLRMSNAHFSKRCEELGLTERKSLTCTPPSYDQVPKHLVRHFIRGYFDGDGSVSLIMDRVPRLCSTSTIGTTVFCEWIKKEVESVTGQKTGNVNKNYATEGLSNYKTICVPQTCRFLHYIYKDATIYLNRKFDKYIAILANKKDLQIRASAKSRFFGVYMAPTRYMSSVHVNGKNVHLGTFRTAEEAAIVHDQWCVNHNHNLDRLNFPIENYDHLVILAIGPSV